MPYVRRDCWAWLQYLTEMFERMKEIKRSPPDDLEGFVLLRCLFQWLVLATAILRVRPRAGPMPVCVWRRLRVNKWGMHVEWSQSRPKMMEVEQQLNALRIDITEYTVNMKPLQREVSVCLIISRIMLYAPIMQRCCV